MRKSVSEPQPGDVVEWQPTHAMRKMRGTVTRIVNGTVYLRIHRVNNRGRRVDSDVWFEPEEAHRLVVVATEKIK